MDKKRPKDSIIPLSLRLNPAEHFQLRELARYNRRSMNEEALYLVEEAAKAMRLKLDTSDAEFSSWASKAAEKLGKSKKEYTERLKADYEKRHEIVVYYDGPDITWEEVIRERISDVVLNSDLEIQDGFVALADDVKKHRRYLAEQADLPPGDKEAR
jgi:hypothetical protein